MFGMKGSYSANFIYKSNSELNFKAKFNYFNGNIYFFSKYYGIR